MHTEYSEGSGILPPSLDALLHELDADGDNTEELSRRISLCEQALEQIERKAHPQLWAMLQDALGTSLMQNGVGNRDSNVERAISCYHAALEVYRRDTLPIEWAATTNNCGIAY